MSTRADRLLKYASDAFRVGRLRRHVRVPDPCVVTEAGRSGTLVIDGVVTEDDASPRWDNLAFLIHSVQPEDSVDLWKRRLDVLPVDAALVANVDDAEARYFLFSRDDGGKTLWESVEEADLFEQLVRYADDRFAPRRLARLRRGQLTFADAAMQLRPGTLPFAARHLQQLDEALAAAVLGAVEALKKSKRHSPTVATHTVQVAIAYLAARILEDKGVIAADGALMNDPVKLLRETIKHRNGFFKKAVHMALPSLDGKHGEAAFDQLALHLGSANTFALVDHHDVGLLYERILGLLPEIRVEKRWRDLQQHYTPIGVTERMLERLPLERLPPERRFIFDPAAGSGSLLLASSLRLSSMKDLPVRGRTDYLAEHVIGNDIDELARDVTNLRYVLAQETVGGPSALPAPSVYSSVKYQQFTRDNLTYRPGAVVANPPYANDKNGQRAADFVNRAVSWLDDGAQFAFVLPQSFMHQNTDGVGEARRALTRRCQIFEVWQLPEGVTGLVARQAVCVVLGVVGRDKYRGTVARAIFSGAGAKEIRDTGFLGPAWLAQLEPVPATQRRNRRTPPPGDDWRAVGAPPVEFRAPTVPLESLFVVYTGATPKAGKQPVKAHPPNLKAVPYWRPAWRANNSLWANPDRVPDDERWRLWRDLKRKVERHKDLIARSKVMLHNSTNRNADEPHRPCFDDFGFWPDHNVHCVSVRAPDHQRRSGMKRAVNSAPRPTPSDWWTMGDRERLLWLTGLLGSDLGTDLWMAGRSTQHASKDTLHGMRLPASVDQKIVALVEQIIRDEKGPERTPAERQKTRAELNAAVAASYGSPMWVRIPRVGPVPEMAISREERTEPTFTVVGQVLEVDPTPGRNWVRVHMLGTLDESPETWIPLPQEMPGWALDGTPFEADLNISVETFKTLAERPWSLRNFRHAPRPYRTLNDLKTRIEAAEE